jgi:hypothetical protein
VRITCTSHPLSSSVRAIHRTADEENTFRFTAKNNAIEPHFLKDYLHNNFTALFNSTCPFCDLSICTVAMPATTSGADTTPNGAAKSRDHNQGNQGRKYTIEQKTAVIRVRKCSPTAFYDILGLEDVKTTVTDAEIKKAYRKLSLLTHPDKNGHEHADEAFKMVSRAFGVLSDKDKRAKFDRFGGDPDSRFGGAAPQQNPFTGFGGRRPSSRAEGGMGGGGGGGGGMWEEEISPEEMFNRFFGGGMGGGFGGKSEARNVT